MSAKAIHKCASEGCSKPAGMQCPTCLKLSLPSTYFCDQICFKKSWTAHKAIHAAKQAEVAAQISELSNLVEQSSLTSDGRPRVVKGEVTMPMRQVPSHIPRPDYADRGKPLSEYRNRMNREVPVRTPEEIEKIADVCKLGREVLDIAHRAVRPGITTEELDIIVHEACIARDAYPSPLNYNHFPKACCTSVNEVICHGIPDSRPLQDGDIVNIDVSLYKHGYHSDLNETYLVGSNVDDKSAALVQNAYECLEKAIAMVKPGTFYRDLGNVIEKHANDAGFSVVRAFVAHGVGTDFHGEPSFIPHYAKNKAAGVMKVGHVFTIEPMINAGVWKESLWPDDWTAVTADLKRSAQFEHTMVVTENGCRVLTARLPDSLALEFMTRLNYTPH